MRICGRDENGIWFDKTVATCLGVLCFLAFWGAVALAFTVAWWWALLCPLFYFGIICFVGSEVPRSFFRPQ